MLLRNLLGASPGRFGSPRPQWLFGCQPVRKLRLAQASKSAYIETVSEIIFEVTQEGDGGFCAECLTEGIVTQGDTWPSLRTNVKEAVAAYYFDRPKPQSIRLHLVRDEMLALG